MLSENIKTLRKQKGYSQEQLADKLNVVRQTVSKWEKGYSVPDADMLEELADIFEISVGDLLGKEIMTEEETTDIGELVKQLKILNDYFSEKIRRKKKRRNIFKGVCSCICIIAIIISVGLVVCVAVDNWQYIFEDQIELNCTLDDKDYDVRIRYYKLSEEIQGANWTSGMPETINDMLYSEDMFERKVEDMVEEIYKYFTENGGACEIRSRDEKLKEKIIEILL